MNHSLGLVTLVVRDYDEALAFFVGKLGFDTHFIRTWNYYLAYCEAAFANRNISVIQGLWTVPNNPTL